MVRRDVRVDDARAPRPGQRARVATAGIDALAFIRACQFGIQLFFPITVLSVCVFIPVHVSGSALDQEREDFLKLGGSAEKLT